MNFKTISTILAVISLDVLVLSSPINNKDNSTDAVDLTIGVDNSKFIAKDIYLMDETEITKTNSEEETTDLISDVEVNVFVNEEIDSLDEETDSLDEETDIVDEDENICNTKECNDIANKLLNNIDTSVDPCEDFYQFTCGNYIKNNKVDDNNILKQNFVMGDDNMDELLKILKGDYQPKNNLSKQDQEYDENIFNKLKGFFKSCMDDDSHNKIGYQPLIDLINQLKIDEKKDKFNDPDELAKMYAELYLYSHPSLFQINIGIKEKEYYIELKGSGSFIKSTQENAKNEIKNLLSNIFEGRDTDKMYDTIREFEGKLFDLEDNEVTNIDEKNFNHISNNDKNGITLKTLNEKYPFINWKVFLDESFKSAGVENLLTDETRVEISGNEEYFEKLNKALTEDNREALAYYFEFYIILTYRYFLPENMNQYVVLGDDVKEEICFNYTNDIMDIALARYYIEKNFSPNKKEFSEKVIEYIKQSMMNRIPKMEWLDEETIEYAYKKVAAMTDIIGYQDFVLDTKAVYEMYKELEIKDNDFLSNMISVNKNEQIYMKRLLVDLSNNESESDRQISIPPQIVNAFYDPSMNKMIIPAGILQPPFFSTGIPDYINYGGIGTIIGHEFIHAFDNTGKNYDINGNINNWWTSNDLEEYENLTQCFIDQYNQFYIEDLEGKKRYNNGELTLDENLADNGGLARSYDSWKLSLMEDAETVKKNNQQLPGLTKYTKDQLFFISYGNIWCKNVYRDSNILDYFLYDSHSLNSARVNGAISNSKEFAKAFNCPLKSKMNPENKCEIW